MEILNWGNFVCFEFGGFCTGGGLCVLCVWGLLYQGMMCVLCWGILYWVIMCSILFLVGFCVFPI